MQLSHNRAAVPSGPPMLSITPVTQQVSQGTPVTNITCTAWGYPEPTVTWYAKYYVYR